MRRIKHPPTPVNPSTSQLLSYRRPDGLILSTGNLYFTYHDAATASVWRAAQTAVPGQEILLYSEPGVRFGDIVFANVGGVFWGYFFSDDGGGNVSIKRVPLTGGAATILATVTDIDDMDGAGEQADRLAVQKSRADHGQIMQVAAGQPRVVGDVMVARPHRL